jgi:tyrosyl-tRNA synthetase
MTDAQTRTAVIDDLAARGLIAQSTDLAALREAAAQGPLTLYCGFDPTAPSLHLGNLVQIITVRRFQLAGHQPIALVGGSTGLIGDPKMSGERTLNPVETVREWEAQIRGQLERFFDFDGSNAAIMVNNYDWTAPMSALEFLRDIGKHFSVNRMLDREAVAARLAGAGISYTEFSYQILQSLDYLELFRRYGCTLQTGGSDQWGNITAGVDLVRRAEGASVHALTTPLLTKADGTKFGKTESGTLWLSKDLTSPWTLFQYFLNADDRDVATYLRIYSLRPLEEVEAIITSGLERPAAREVQRALASELTALVHGQQAATDVEAAAAALFGGGDLRDIAPETLAAALAETPTGPADRAALPTMTELMVTAGLVDSKGAARRAIAEGGAYLNNERISDTEHVPEVSDLIHDRWLVLRRGKRTIASIDTTST